MKCPSCNCHFEGKRCPNCGAAATMRKERPNPAEISETHGFRLFGFRSHKGWKMAISCLYLLICLLMLLGCFLSQEHGTMPQKDVGLEIGVDICMIFLFFSPYIFLSDSPIRNVLPLFRRRKAGTSFLGMLLVFILTVSMGNWLDNMHTEEYKADQENHAYVQTEYTEPSCEEDGQVKYVCSFCCDTHKETIPASGHDYEKTELEDGTIHYRCVNCGHEYSYHP